jgi:glutamate synthase domain-containing protein 3
MPELPEGAPLRRVRPQEPVLDDALDWELVEAAGAALQDGTPVTLERPIRNVNRCVGGILSSHIAKRHGAKGLPDETIHVEFRGSAGQSFGGWLAPGVSFRLHGDANDYTGKGLSGGTLTVLPPDGVTYVAEQNVLIGNTVLYGATSGKAFFRGLAGERFAVRNSGASAVIEGVGDHGCEYMTGGRVVVLGSTGRNFAAGMSGGLAFVLDEDGSFPARVNPAMRDQLEPLDEGDAIEVRSLVAEHAERTGSPVAQRVLDEWDELLAHFVKIFPADYKRVLAELAAAESASSNGSGNGAVTPAKKAV